MSKPHKRGVGTRPNSELAAHLAKLGLETEAQYREWCHQHGFAGATNKGWSGRRQERLALRRDLARAEEERVVEAHLEALGLPSADAYRAWCRALGLSEALNKGPDQRKRELRLRQSEGASEALGRARNSARSLAEVLALLTEMPDDAETPRNPLHALLADLMRRTGGEQRPGLIGLLLFAEAHSSLLSSAPALESFGEVPGNTYPDALAAIARCREQWLRPLQEWRPSSRSPRKQIASLLRHLLALYDVPPFLDSVWFQGDAESACRRQGWWIHVATGGNIRRTDIPLVLTSRMAHHFLLAPKGCTVDQALRWGQVLGMGGSESLARALIATRLGHCVDGQEVFWATVVRFFVNNPMLDPAQIGPIVDYLYAQRFAEREEVGEDGRLRTVPPPQPELSMKGRTPLALLRLVDDWHRELSREHRLPEQAWHSCGIAGFEREARVAPSGRPMVWTIHELLSTRELGDEGRAMSHCVRSYSPSCSRGATSIWSLQVYSPEIGTCKRVLTIAVRNASRTISEIRGKRNAFPSGGTPDSRARASRADQELMREGRRWIDVWADEVGLRVSKLK
ncbi:MAG TPA: PcfJ domain-containing protein [Armatimonadota bacterium]